MRRGEKPGFPRYRSLHRYDNLTFPSYGNGCALLASGKLRVHGAGQIKVKLHRLVEGTIKTVTIKRDVNHWYVCFSVERDAEPLPISVAEIGIDVGLNSFAVLSDGAEIDNPRQLKRELPHVRRCQRKLARRKRGSNRRGKARLLLAKAHRKIRNQRAAFHHHVSCWLVDTDEGEEGGSIEPVPDRLDFTAAAFNSDFSQWGGSHASPFLFVHGFLQDGLLVFLAALV